MRRQALATLIVFMAGWAWFSVMAALRFPAGVDPDAMTVGCPERCCCSSRCYLDHNGKHHCVPKENASCTCGLSSQERDSGALMVLEPGVLPTPDRLYVEPSPTVMICSHPSALHETDLTVPTPPPRAGFLA